MGVGVAVPKRQEVETGQGRSVPAEGVSVGGSGQNPPPVPEGNLEGRRAELEVPGTPH